MGRSLILRITGLFVSLAVAIYLWFDAPKHDKDKWLWAILGVLAPVRCSPVFI
ncbi:hypothetical protein ACEQPO_08800 [Bacillus sp. SL00103]